MRHYPATTLSPDVILKNLANEGARRMRVSGVFSARGTGIKRFLGSMDLDIVAQYPDSLYISMRSFFSQPARVFATNGQQIFLLEMTDPQKPLYRTHPVGAEDIKEVLPLPLTPQEVVEVVLGIAPVVDITLVNLVVDDQRGTYKAELHQPSGRVIMITARLSDHVLLSRALREVDGRIVYSVAYEDFRAISGIDFAHRWDFDVNLKDKTYGISLLAKDITLNGEAFSAATFQLEPP